MTQTSHLKSAQITALDTYQPVGDVQNAGLGAPCRTITISGTVTPVAADAAGSTYRMARVPSTAVIKYIGLSSQAQGAGKVQVGVYYSDSAIDGTAAANQGNVVSGCVDFFASDVDLTSAVNQTDETFGNAANAGKNNQSLINTPLWKACGLTTDPGGMLDIVLTVHTTAITTGGGFVSLQAEYAE